MNQTRFTLSVRRLGSLAAMLMLAAAPGCGSAPMDTTAALDALSAIHSRLADAAEEQQALSGQLATTVTDIAAERLRLALLLDLDELLTPAGLPDRDAIERLLRAASDNAVVREVRLGRMTLDEANQIVGDAAAARSLSPGLRSATEEHLIMRFADWQRLATTREAIIAGLDQQRRTTARLLEEAGELTGAIREATAFKLDRSIRVNAAAQSAVDLIHDAETRESIRVLLDVLLTSPDTTSARSQDQ